jgi:hypothetical protein
MNERSSSSVDLYISTEGDDSWSGTLSEPNAGRTDGPFLTIDGARLAIQRRKGVVQHRQVRRHYAEMRSPMTVWLRGGRYEVEGPIVFGEEDSAPVTYAAYPGEKPIIDGSRRIKGWKTATVNGVAVWIAHIPEVEAGKWNFRELYVEGRRCTRPRYPKEGLLQMAGVAGIRSERKWQSDDTQFVAAEGDFREFKNLDEVEIIYLHRWLDERSRIVSYDPSSRVVTMERPSMSPLEGRGEIRLADYYLENIFEEMKSPGEWYLDRPTGKLYYVPEDGQDPENTEVRAPRSLQLLALKGNPDTQRYVEFLRFEEIAFEHTDWRHPDASDGAEFIEPSGYHEVFQRFDYHRGHRAGSLQAACDVPGVIFLEAARHCTFQNCTVQNVGWYGIEIADGCTGIAVDHCTIRTTGAGGVKLNGASIAGSTARRTGAHAITDNEITSGGRVFHSAVGVLSMHCHSTAICHNHIHDYYYTGISCGWDWGYMETVSRDNLIEKNHIHNIGQGLLSDMGGIYTLGVQPGTVLRGNLIHDITKAHYGGWCIYPDEGSSHMLIEHNICYSTNDSVFNQHYGRENLVRNNIFAFGGESVLAHGRADLGQKSIRFERNILVTDGKPIFRGGYSWKFDDRNHTSDLNLLWDIGERDVSFSERETGSTIDLRAWRNLGHDVHSVIADPGLADLQNGDFSLAADSPAFALGFEPIDLSDVGPR